MITYAICPRCAATLAVRSAVIPLHRWTSGARKRRTGVCSGSGLSSTRPRAVYDLRLSLRRMERAQLAPLTDPAQYTAQLKAATAALERHAEAFAATFEGK